MATDGASGPTTDATCVRENDGFRLREVQPIHHSPWLPTFQYACLGITFAASVPFCAQMGVMVWRSKIDLPANLANTTSFSEVRVLDDFFDPFGVYIGCLISFIFCLILVSGSHWLPAALCGGMCERAERALQGLSHDTAEFCSKFRCCCKRATDAGEDTLGGGGQAKKRSCGCVVFFVLFVLMTLPAPLAVWYGPLQWWKEAAELYRLCHRVCHFADLDSDGLQACNEHMLITPNTIDEARVYENVTEDDKAFCYDVMNRTEMSAYTQHVLEKGHTFLAFESNLRQHFRVSCLDIFNSTLEFLLFIIVLGARVALREQFGTLRRIRVMHIKTNMLTSCRELKEWKKFFRKLLKEIDDRPDSWTLKLLREVEQRMGSSTSDATLQSVVRQVFEEVKDQSEDNVIEKEYEAPESVTRADIIFTVSALVSAAVDAFVPFGCRYFFTGGVSPWLISAKYPKVMQGFQYVSFLSIGVGFLGASSSFYLLSSAYVSSQSQINSVVAFDCLFRFPFEHPQTTVLLANGKMLLKELKSKKNGSDEAVSPAPEDPLLPPEFTPRPHIQDREPPLPSNDRQPSASSGPDLESGLDTSSSSRGSDDNSEYFAQFTTLESMEKQVDKFHYYFFGRYYLQVDKVDERNNLEVAMVVALLSLIPRLLIVLCNWQLETGQRKILQPANLAFLWRLFYVFLMCMLSLTETMNLNEQFSAHRTRLRKLLDYCKYSNALKGNKQDSKAANCIQSTLALMDSHDIPSTLFGVKVRWQMLASFVLVWSLSLPSTLAWLSQLIDTLGASV